MREVAFHDAAEDALFRFAVIAARSDGKWVFCRHAKRDSWECPGGHREAGESIEETARRELYEETGALEFTLSPVCAYSVAENGGLPCFCMLYYADIAAFGPLPPFEIAEVALLKSAPDRWTYPDIQPLLLARAAAQYAQA